MDVDDDFLIKPAEYRRIGCRCALEPVPPRSGLGCRCPSCGSVCRLCMGFGLSSPKRYHEILSRVRAQVRQLLRTRGHPPGYIRITEADLRVLLQKRRREDPDHWITEYVDPGPPPRVFDMLVVVDRRKR